jgi:proteasome lid subunit RPN8/RPN11
MIYLPKDIAKEIIAHAKRDLPNEACGYLVGKDNLILKSFALTNVDKSPEHYSFDPAEQFNVVKQARKEGMVILANYHSHPQTLARPSEEDIKLAFDPDISYVIISLSALEPVINSFIIKKLEATKEEIIIVE